MWQILTWLGKENLDMLGPLWYPLFILDKMSPNNAYITKNTLLLLMMAAVHIILSYINEKCCLLHVQVNWPSLHPGTMY